MIRRVWMAGSSVFCFHRYEWWQYRRCNRGYFIFVHARFSHECSDIECFEGVLMLSILMILQMISRSWTYIYHVESPCRERDQDSFPPSSYTLAPCLRKFKASPVREFSMSYFVAMNGPLVLFSAWMQEPQPPAIESVPLEKRNIYGILDTLLQITYVIYIYIYIYTIRISTSMYRSMTWDYMFVTLVCYFSQPSILWILIYIYICLRVNCSEIRTSIDEYMKAKWSQRNDRRPGQKAVFGSIIM